MHEEKCQTAARKKRKTLYPHIFLLTEGRLGCVVFALFPIWFLLMEVKSLALGGFNFADLLGIVVSSAVIAATFFYFIPHYWPLCFGKLTLTENYVKWHGLFIRSVKIPYSELRHVEIRQFREGNVMRNADLYRTGQEYVLMSVDSLPKTRIDKIRSGDGLIKYQFLMRDAAVFSEYLPERYKPMFQSRAETYTRAKEKRARDWQKWKAKRKKAREKRRKKRQAEK